MSVFERVAGRGRLLGAAQTQCARVSSAGNQVDAIRGSLNRLRGAAPLPKWRRGCERSSRELEPLFVRQPCVAKSGLPAATHSVSDATAGGVQVDRISGLPLARKPRC